MTTKKQKTTRKPPKGVKRSDQVWAMVERSEGVTIDEIVAATGMKPHSARAVLSIESRKRTVVIELGDDKRYRVSKAGK